MATSCTHVINTKICIFQIENCSSKAPREVGIQEHAPLEIFAMYETRDISKVVWVGWRVHDILPRASLLCYLRAPWKELRLTMLFQIL